MTLKSILAFMVALGIVLWVTVSCFSRTREAELAPVVSVERGRLQLSIHASGVMDWEVRLPVHMPLSGRLDELLVQEGQRVEKGDRVALMSGPQRAILRDLDLADPPRPGIAWDEVYRPIPIRAPRSGRVVDVMAASGQNLVVHQPMFWIADRLVARVIVEENDLRLIAVGSEAELSFYALPDLTRSATVTRVSARTDPERRRDLVAHQVDLELGSLPEHVHPGMSVTMRLDGPGREDALLVPNTALTLQDGKTGVRLVVSEDSHRFQPVETGLSDGATTEILAGVNEGDRIWADADWAPAAPPRRRGMGAIPLVPYARRERP